MSAFDDQVREFIEEHEGMSFIAKQARTLYDERDYERLERFMSEVWAVESQNHFYETEQVGANDVY